VSAFLAESVALAQRLPQREFAINLHADRYKYLRAFCAAIIAGQCTLMPANRQPHTIRQLREIFKDNYILGEDGSEPELGEVVPAEVPDIDPAQRCAIAFTSGSTGVPKPNEKFWNTLTEGARANKQLLLGAEHEHLNIVATVPPQHMWGLETTILMPLVTKVAISDCTPFYPGDIVDAIDNLPDPVALVSSPIHLEALLKSGVKPKRLDRILTATAPLTKELAKRLQDRFETRVQDVFGCTESGILATRDTSTEEFWTYADVFDLYVSREGVRIRADHLPEDALLPDIVELVGDRQYRWCGRQADMVNIAGKRGSIADINHQLRGLSGVVDGVVFAREDNPDRLAALVVAPGMEVSTILDALKERVEPVFLPRPMYKVDMLPRQETGKIAVKAVHDMFERIRAEKAD
jgi:acyl-coenzyme A synthetase/AMP-(fatty) acid ligase